MAAGSRQSPAARNAPSLRCLPNRNKKRIYGKATVIVEQIRISALRNDDLFPCLFLHGRKSSEATLMDERKGWGGPVGKESRI